MRSAREIARNGLHKIMLVNGHGGNNSLLGFFLESRLAQAYDYAVYSGRWALCAGGRAGHHCTMGEQGGWPRRRMGDQRHRGAAPGPGALGRLAATTTRGCRADDSPGSKRQASAPRTGGMRTIRRTTAATGVPVPPTRARGRWTHRRAAWLAMIRLVKEDDETRRLLDEFHAAAVAPLAAFGGAP